MYLVVFGGFYWEVLLYLCCTRVNKKGAKLSFNSLIFSGRDTTALHPEIYNAERGGFEPPVQLPVRQFSKLVVSATHPPLQK